MDEHALPLVKHSSHGSNYVASGQTLLQGLEHLFDSVTGNIDQAMLSFERLAAVTSLSVPAELFIEQVRPPPPPPTVQVQHLLGGMAIVTTLPCAVDAPNSHSQFLTPPATIHGIAACCARQCAGMS